MCSVGFFLLKFDHPDWVAMQTRQAGLEGTGEIRLRETREAVSTDEAIADDRRRG
jgi:hypothetical protein